MKLSTCRRWLAAILALSLFAAPVVPTLGAPVDTDPHAAHAGHEMAQAGHDHAMDTEQAAVAKGDCEQHGFGGQCCSTCAHCVTTISLFSLAAAPAASVKVPAISHLRESLPSAVHDRPPQVL